MKYCTFCRNKLKENAKFCIECGKTVLESNNVQTHDENKVNLDTKKSNNSKIFLFVLFGIILLGVSLFFSGAFTKKTALAKNIEQNIEKLQKPSYPISTNLNEKTSDTIYIGYETGIFPVYIKRLYKNNDTYFIDVDIVQIAESKNEDLDEKIINNYYTTLRTYKLDNNCKVLIQNVDRIKDINEAEPFLEYLNFEWKERVFYITLNNRTCKLINQMWTS